MEPVIISWTPTNWATIFLMAVGGVLIFNLGVMAIKWVANRGMQNG
jgi:hypothetical protein